MPKENGNIEVWALPESISPDGIAYYGGEFTYEYNEKGDSLINATRDFRGYKGYKPNPVQTIRLNNTHNKVPSVGNIFYSYLHKRNFKLIIIANTDNNTAMIFNPKTNDVSWVHIIK